MRAFWFGILCVAAGCGAKASTTKNDSSGSGVLTGTGGMTSSANNSSSSSSSSSKAASSSSSAAVGAGGGSAGGGGAAMSCVDGAPSEPNQAEVQAFKLKGQPISDCDGDGGSVDGVINGTDVDWYTYQGNDKFGCTVDPTRTLSPTDQGLRVCKYLECLNGLGNTVFTCPAGTTADKSADGRPGCCGSKGFTISLNCKGSIDDVAYVYIRIDVPGANAATCVSYKLDYHY